MNTIPNEPAQPLMETEEDGIDLIAVAKTLWNGRKTILLSVGVCLLLGLVVAFTTPKEYTVTTVMVPQVNTGGKSGLSSLASLAGFDLSSMNQSSDLSPMIYPQIVNSIPFKLELMNTPVHFEELDTAISVFDYYTTYQKTSVVNTVKKYTLGLPGVLIKMIKGEPALLVLPSGMKNKPLQLTEDQSTIKKLLDEKIGLDVDTKQGYLTLSVSLSEPLVAAEIAQKAQALLQQYITQFKIEKSAAELEFIQDRYNVAKADAEGYQYGMASNLDKYKNLTSNVPQVSNTRLQTKYGIANSVYIELAKQLEQAKIQVKKDTPVFTIVEPVAIPNEKSSSGKAKILAIWLFLGVFVGCGLVYGKQFIIDLKLKWGKI